MATQTAQQQQSDSRALLCNVVPCPLGSALRMGRAGASTQPSLLLRRGATGSGAMIQRSTPLTQAAWRATTLAAAAVPAIGPAWPSARVRPLSSHSHIPPPRSPFGFGSMPPPPPPPPGAQDPFSGHSSPNPHYEALVHSEPPPDPRYNRYAWMLVGANLVVFLMWSRANRPEGQVDPAMVGPGMKPISVHQLPLYVRMYRHWVTSLHNLTEGRAYTLLTSAFSHQALFHLVANMMGVVMLMPGVMSAIGIRRTAVVYLGAAVTASTAHLFYSNVIAPFVLHRPPGTTLAETRKGTLVPVRSYDTPALGASGAVMAMAVIFAFLYPRTKFYLMFIPVPVQARYMVPGVLLIDFAMSMRSGQGFGMGVAHWGHLGGALFGALYYLLSIRRRRVPPPRPYIDPRDYYLQQRYLTEAIRMREAWILGKRNPQTGEPMTGPPVEGPDAPIKPIFPPRPAWPAADADTPTAAPTATSAHRHSSRYVSSRKFKRTTTTTPPPPPTRHEHFSTIARRGR